MELMGENKDNICPVCIEELDPKKEARLENCVHKFCFPCIHCWATQNKNLCPMCKQKFNKIYKMKDDLTGEEVVEVDDLDVDAEETQENLMCRICDLRI